MQGLVDETISDPAAVELDAFSKLHRDGKIPVPGREAMDVVCEEHAWMAKNPYQVETEDDYSYSRKIMASAVSQETTQTTNQTSGTNRKRKQRGGAAQNQTFVSKRGTSTSNNLSGRDIKSTGTGQRRSIMQRGRQHSQMTSARNNDTKS